MRNFWLKIRNLGIHPGLTRHERRTRVFFNIATFFGGVSCIPQFFWALDFDSFTAASVALWGVICFTALYIHGLGHYKWSRFIAFFFLLTFGGFTSARIGHDVNPHIVSFALILSIFITHDLKKEWKWVAFYLLYHSSIVVLIESDLIKAEGAQPQFPMVMRSVNVIGTMLFMYLEVRVLLEIVLHGDRKYEKELEQKNEDLESRISENTVMLQEINHRVKNNLQIISSLLRIQSYEIDDPITQRAFEESIGRVGAMGLLHEKMYQSENLAQVGIEGYLTSLSKEMVLSHGMKDKVEINTSCEVERINNQSLVPFALIYYELLRQTLNNVPEPSVTLKIDVRLEYATGNNVVLTYRDNCAKKSMEEDTYLGLNLVEVMTEQLSGNMQHESDSTSTTFRLELPDLN